MLPLNPFSTPRPAAKPMLQFPPIAEGPSRPLYYTDPFIDQRLSGFRGKSRSATLSNVSSMGGSVICKNQDGTRCVVAGKDCENVYLSEYISVAYTTFSSQNHPCA